MVDRRQMHRAALAAHQSDVALHQFAKHFGHCDAARQRMRMAAIGAEGKIARLHGAGKACGHGLLAERQMAGAFRQIFQEEIRDALLGLPDHNLCAIHVHAQCLTDVIVRCWRRTSAL
jgi:hypothetical protein